MMMMFVMIVLRR